MCPQSAEICRDVQSNKTVYRFGTSADHIEIHNIDAKSEGERNRVKSRTSDLAYSAYDSASKQRFCLQLVNWRPVHRKLQLLGRGRRQSNHLRVLTELFFNRLKISQHFALGYPNLSVVRLLSFCHPIYGN